MLLSLGSLARSEPPHWPSPPTSLSPSSSPLPPSLAPPPPSRSLSPTPPPSPSPPEPSPPPPPSPLLPTLSYPPVQPVSGQGISEQEAIKLFGTQGVHIINTMKNWVGLFFKYQDGAYRFPGDDLFHGSLSLNNLDGFPENAILNVAASCGYGIKSCSVRVELSLPSPFNLLYQEQGDYFSEFYTRQAFPPPPSPLPPPEPSPPPPPEPSPPPPFSPMPSSPFSPGGNQDMTLGIFCLLLFQHFCISCEQKFTDRSVQALNVKRISRDIHGAVQLCAAHLLINYLNLNLALDALLKTEFNTYLFYKTLSNESSLNYLSFISSKIRLFGSFVALTTVSLTSINDVSIMQAHLDRDYALKKYYTQIVLFCFTLSILYLLHSSRTNNYLRRVSNNLRRVSNNFYAFIDPSVVRGRSVVVANVLIPNEGERRSLQPNTEIIRGVVIGVRIHAQPNSQERLRTNLASEVVGDQGIELVEIGGQSEPAQLNPLGITSPDLANQMGSPEGIEFAQISDQLQTHFENQEASVRAVQVRAEQANQEVPVVINLETSQMQEGIVRGSVFIEETLRRSHSERVAATHQEPSVWDSARHWLESQMAYIFPEDELVAADQA